MPDKLRQPAGLILFFGGGLCSWLLWGLTGLAGAFLGVTATWAALGCATGYWVGIDADAEHLVTGAMKRLREIKGHSAKAD